MAKRHGNQAGDLESMFLRLEELVLANSGEDEFEEVFKLLIAKLLDERTGKETFRVHATEQETHLAVLSLLRQAEKTWPGVLDDATPRLSPEHLAVCVEALAKHSIANEGLEVMDGFFEFMVAKAAKGAKGQFFTPRHVVELCVRMMNPRADETVVDPACGSGGFLVHTLNHVAPTDTAAYCGEKLWGFDMDARATRVAKALMIMAGDGAANVIRVNSLLQPGMAGLFGEDDSVLTIEDVCRGRLRRHKGFDVVLTNPPFAGEVRERQLLEGYFLAKNKARVERDVLFIERCLQLLRPGGRMAMVLPHNKFAAESFAHVRDFLMRKGRVLAVVGLGRNTFLPHTHQKASVVFVKKLDEGEKPRRDYNIFFSISEQDGKNSRGQFITRSKDGPIWTRVAHDLADIEHGFRDFCESEKVEV